MSEKFGRRSILTNIFWKLFERGSSLLVSFAVNIVLARILDPSDFGLSAIVTVFVTLSQIFVSGGPANALIQKKDADELDFSSVFWVNLFISGFLYLLLFFLAPIIANFYGYAQLSPMLRVLGLNLIIAAVNSIQGAYISRNMLFRYYFQSTLSGKIGSGIIGIAMALAGFGVWALVGQSVSLLLFESIILWFRVKWRPRRLFSWLRVKTLYSFAWRIMLMSFVENIGDQLRKMFIGKQHSAADLAFYDKGSLFPSSIIINLTSSLGAVMFPVLSDAQDDKSRSITICRLWTRLFAYTAFPLLTGLIAVAKPLIIFVLTDKWLPSVPFMQLACLAYVAWIIEIPIRETIKSFGRSDICLRMQIIKTAFAIVSLVAVMNCDVIVIAVFAVVAAVFNIVVSMYYGHKFIEYSPRMLWTDLVKTISLNIVMGLLVFMVSLLSIPNSVMVLIQVLVAVVSYVGLSMLTKNENYTYLRDMFKGIVSEKKR